jgi:oligoribonuclease NrnB/cAMP/cGMP phosphodiesterase (DHH superfamily)
MDKSNVIIYHNDLDGFGAAYALWTVFKDSADYYVWNYDKPIDYDLIQNKNVIIVDFSFPLSITKQIKNYAINLEIIDHHPSAEQELGHLNYFSYFPSMSGATAAWVTYVNNNPPLLLKYIEDRDLWHNQLPNCEEIIYAIESYSYNFEQFDIWVKDGQKAIDKLILEGKTIKRSINKQIDKIIKCNVHKIKINDDIVYAVNSPVYQSEIGHILAKQGKYGVVYYDKDRSTIFSLRSTGNEDVSIIARKFGGGGHKAAAGFITTSRMRKVFSGDVVEDNMEELFRELDEATLIKYREGKTKHGALDIENDPRDFLGEEAIQEGEDLLNYFKVGLIKLLKFKEKLNY